MQGRSAAVSSAPTRRPKRAPERVLAAALNPFKSRGRRAPGTPHSDILRHVLPRWNGPGVARSMRLRYLIPERPGPFARPVAS